MDSPQQLRLRQHPEERFAGPQHAFDLQAAADHLRQELRTSGTGHRQQSLYKLGPTSLSLFLFSSKAFLAPHRTKGTVIIQVLKGHLLVTAEGHPHDLHAGGVVVLAAGVQHEVVAQEETEMLLNVHLASPATPPQS